jgi:hypothetical protein
MRNEWIWLILLAFIIFLAGCVGQQPITEFKNDIITIEDYSIPQTVYSGSSNSMEFYIRNNGDEPVGNVEVNFFDVPDCFSVVSLKCDGEKADDNKCVYNDIESGDVRLISLQLKAKSVEYKTPCPVSFSVKYDYNDSRQLNVPIFDRNANPEKKTPSLTGSQSSSGYGPILLDIQTSAENAGTANEYWVAVDEPFELDFKFTHVGTITNVGTTLNVEKVNLSSGSVKLTYSGNLEIPNDLPCDFNDSLSTKSITITGDETRDLLICNFQAKQIKQSEEIGWAQVDYSYTYKYTVTQSFDITPR